MTVVAEGLVEPNVSRVEFCRSLYLKIMPFHFEKDLPGAECLFQPPELADYAGEPWDIRISIGDSPLEEAYYCTVQDPDAVQLSIRELLEKYALNRECQAQLDIERYPELPFLQEELLQCYENCCNGRLALEIYVNHRPEPRPVQLNEPAAPMMSICRFLDNSWDYRLLDLVFVPLVPELEEEEQEELHRQYGPVYLLLLLAHQEHQGDESFREFLQQEPFDTFFGRSLRGEFPHVTEAVETLSRRSQIR